MLTDGRHQLHLEDARASRCARRRSGLLPSATKREGREWASVLPISESNPPDYSPCRPRVHEFLKEMNVEVLAHYPGCVTVGETPFTRDPDLLLPYVKPSSKELNMVRRGLLAVDGYL